jgi:hypothetical protein
MISTIRKIQCPSVPTKELWQILNNISPITPQEFTSYWDVNYTELALICGCSKRTVKRWFALPNSSCYLAPQTVYKLRLALVHHIWYSLSSK